MQMDRCADCPHPSVLQLFDGRRMVPLCDTHHRMRVFRPAPPFQLEVTEGRTFLMGHAAPLNALFRRRHSGELTCFERGAFSRLSAPVYFGVNHEVCMCVGCFPIGGRPTTLPLAELINMPGALASTDTGTLLVAEDLWGLFFIAHISNECAIQYKGEDRVVLVDAVRDGHCSEVSIHFHGGRGSVKGPQHYTQVNLVELSLSVKGGVHDGRGDAPDTSVQLAGTAAMHKLYGRLRSVYDGQEI
jgi:hypothetical protein